MVDSVSGVQICHWRHEERDKGEVVRERRGFGVGWGVCVGRTSVGERCQLRKMFYKKNLVKYFTSFLQCIFSFDQGFTTKQIPENAENVQLKQRECKRSSS